jgi:serine kinase of HPr protein (carbohydrate metabolism regulator)
MTAVANGRATSIHASAVRIGDLGILIRGPSGAGKSRLAFDLILAGRAGQLPPTVLVGDDRIYLANRGGHLTVRPAPNLAGLIEVRGLGIRRCDHVPEATVSLIVDLGAADGARLPEPESLTTTLFGVVLRRIPVLSDFSALPLIAADVLTTSGYPEGDILDDCRKEIRNHISPTIATK